MRRKKIDKLFQDKSRKQAQFENLRIIADNHNKNHLNELVCLINSILKKHNINTPINNKQVKFFPTFIGNIFIDDPTLSSIIFDSIYPRPSETLFSHYTNCDAGINIIGTKKIWLFSLEKNFDSNEFKQFYEDHGLVGYGNTRSILGCKSDNKAIMSEIFSFSMTSEQESNDFLWNKFAETSRGLKLTFRVCDKADIFRKIYYSDNFNDSKIPLIKDLVSEIQRKYKLPFAFKYISSFGAFYIKGCYSYEDEYRVVIKGTSDRYNATMFKAKLNNLRKKYIEVDFNNDLISFKLTKITKGRNITKEDSYKIDKIVKEKYPDIIIDTQ